MMPQLHHAQASQSSSAKTDRYRFCYIPFQQSRLFRRDRKRWRLRQQHCLEVASRL